MKQQFGNICAIAIYLRDKFGLPVLHHKRWREKSNMRFRVMSPAAVPILECLCSQDRTNGRFEIRYIEYIDVNLHGHDPEMWVKP